MIYLIIFGSIFIGLLGFLFANKFLIKKQNYLVIWVGEVFEDQKIDYKFYKRITEIALKRWETQSFGRILILTSASVSLRMKFSPVQYVRSILINNNIDVGCIKILYDSIDPPKGICWELVPNFLYNRINIKD